MAAPATGCSLYKKVLTLCQKAQGEFSFKELFYSPFSLSKNPVGFHRDSGEMDGIHFRPRRVRGRKYFSPCKRASAASALQQGAEPIAKKAAAFLAVERKEEYHGNSGTEL